jgi:hypothetical protein
MSAEENAHAGQGSVVLDIGADIGALVVLAPAVLAGREIEIWPVDEPRPVHPPHVGIVGRPTSSGIQYGAVFPYVPEGDYQLKLRPDGPVQLRVQVTGGEVCQARWPS